MKTKIFGIKDKKVGIDNIFLMPNEGYAIRDFGNAIQDKSNPNSMLTKFPKDYELVYLGTFNKETGEIIADNRVIASGEQYVE